MLLIINAIILSGGMINYGKIVDAGLDKMER